MIAHLDSEGRVASLQGDPDHPVARGALCARTYKYPERVYSPDRILTPQLREPGAHGAFRSVDWETALDLCAARIERLRREQRTAQFLYVQSSGSMALVKDLGHRFRKLLGGTSYAEGDFCLGAGKTALQRHLGDYRPHAWEDLRAHAECVVLWGRDPFTSGPHRALNLKEARGRGAAIVSINPLIVGPARHLDLHVPVRPGTDAHLAALLVRRLRDAGSWEHAFLESRVDNLDAFDRAVDGLDVEKLAAITGLTADRVDALLALLVGRAPVAFLLGTGMIRHRLGVEAVGWIVALAAVLGSIGRPGGGISYSVRHRRDGDTSWCEPDLPGRDRPLSAGRWHQMILEGLDPPIEMLWVSGMNPVATLPDSHAVLRALERIPFKVVCDFHWTDTARAADLVLPVTSFLEEEGIVTSWGQPHVGRQRRVIPPRGEARTDLWILQELARRLGFGEAMAGDEMTWGRRILDPVLEPAQWDELEERGWTRNRVHEDVPFAGQAFPRPSGQCSLPAGLQAADPHPADAEYPYLFLTPKSRTEHLTQVLPDREPEMYKGRVSRDVADAAGAPGTFLVRSRVGAIPAVLEPDPDLPPGLVVIPMSGSVRRGTAVNLVTQDLMASDGVTPAYYDTRVRVDRIADARA